MGKGLNGKELGKGITQRKDGIYQARVFKPGYGKPIYLYAKNLKEIKKLKQNKESLLANGVTSPKENLTVSAWFEDWIKIYKFPKIKTTTVRNYHTSFLRIKPYLGDIKMKNVVPGNISYYIEEALKNGYAYTTIKYDLSVLYELFQQAFINKMILTNPCNGIRIIDKRSEKPKDPQKSSRPCLSKEEIDLFFNTCKGTRYYDLFVILLNTGMRIGEACALEWKDIDFKNKCINVYKTLNRTQVYYNEQGENVEPHYITQITTPKRPSSIRVIPMNEDAVNAFLSWKKIQLKDKKNKNWGKTNPLLEQYPGLIFTTSTGRSYLPVDADNECRRICRIASKNEKLLAETYGYEPVILDIHVHLFRHTFTTYCVESGMNHSSILKIVGHAHMEMLEYYSHISNNYAQEEFKKFKLTSS